MAASVVLFLFQYYYLFMKVVLLAALVIFFWGFRRAARLFAGVEKKTWFLLFLIVLFGFILRLWVVPHVHQVYLDEFYHLNLAQNLLYNGSFGWCAEGTAQACDSFDFRFWPPVYHTLLSLVLGVFGDAEAVAFNFSSVVGALTPALVFLFVFLLFDDDGIALLAALLFNLIPIHLTYSGASDLTVISVFFVVAALASARVYARTRAPAHLALLAVLIIVAVYTRAENVFLLLLVPLFVFFCRGKQEVSVTAGHTAILLSVLAVCAVPFVLQVIYIGSFVLTEPGWHENLTFYLGNLRRNVPLNISFWSCALHPVSYTVLACFGCAQVWRRDRRLSYFFAGWFAVFFFFVSAIVRDFQYLYVDRLTLKLYIPVVVFAAVGLSALARGSRFRRLLLAFICAAVLLNVWVSYKFACDRIFGNDLYAEYRFVLSSRDKIPDDVYVITYVPPEIIASIHKKSITFVRFFEKSEKPDTAILFKNSVWRDKGERSLEHERRLREIYDFEVMDQVGPTPNGYVYSFVLLTKRSDDGA